MISMTLVRYVLMAALRDRIFVALILMVICGASFSVFLGSSAVVESSQFVQVFAASGLRFAGVLCVTLFVVFHMRRAFETRDVDFLLARPISRPRFILSHAVAFKILALIVAAAVFSAVSVLSPHPFSTGAALWGFSLAMELMIVACAALFFSMVISSAAGAAMAVLGLYVLARLMGELIGISHIGFDVPGYGFMVQALNIIALVTPRLDLMAQSTWLVYGADDAPFFFILAQGVAYSALLSAAAVVDLVRRQF